MTPEFLIGNITLFVLAIFLGFELITSSSDIHTPLMSGADISGISIIGALIGANVAYDGGATAVSEILHLSRRASDDQRRWRLCCNQSNAEYDRWKETGVPDLKDWISLGYLLSATLFIGLKKLGHPRTAPFGNQLGALGMLVAVLNLLVTVLAME